MTRPWDKPTVNHGFVRLYQSSMVRQGHMEKKNGYKYLRCPQYCPISTFILFLLLV